MTRWLPTGLAARIIGLTLLALLVSQAVGYFSFRHGSEHFVQHMIGSYMGRTVSALDNTLQYVAPTHREQVLKSLSRRRSHYLLQSQPPACASGHKNGYAQSLARRLQVPDERVRVCLGNTQDKGARPKQLSVGLQRADGQWLVVRQNLPGYSSRWVWRALRNLLITLVIMIVLVVVVSYWFTRPLRVLARATERFGRGEDVDPVPVRGSGEIRQLIDAFNRMRERIDRFVTERSRVVAALAHDLRSPITALRLRLELMDEDDNTRAMQTTLEEMAHMSEATLAFMREATSTERARRVDLHALVDAVCEDYRVRPADVCFSGQQGVELVCRPMALRRALRNVIDNALAYGGNARVVLQSESDIVCITVADAGPGVPEEKLEAIFDAFVRLEASRNRDTGGTGLGLAITRSIINAHGGQVTLRNRPEGGLVVQMRLPR